MRLCRLQLQLLLPLRRLLLQLQRLCLRRLQLLLLLRRRLLLHLLLLRLRRLQLLLLLRRLLLRRRRQLQLLLLLQQLLLHGALQLVLLLQLLQQLPLLLQQLLLERRLELQAAVGRALQRRRPGAHGGGGLDAGVGERRAVPLDPGRQRDVPGLVCVPHKVAKRRLFALREGREHVEKALNRIVQLHLRHQWPRIIRRVESRRRRRPRADGRGLRGAARRARLRNGGRVRRRPRGLRAEASTVARSRRGGAAAHQREVVGAAEDGVVAGVVVVADGVVAAEDRVVAEDGVVIVVLRVGPGQRLTSAVRIRPASCDTHVA
ncbi:hypothetical protein M885DRAFT_524419 [Pelagophyceae sp. CCMP2097]|nr:hypothetical protein M885DRAFT_524419 [Pelagophyceae sp. CCMP2097]